MEDAEIGIAKEQLFGGGLSVKEFVESRIVQGWRFDQVRCADHLGSYADVYLIKIQ